mmetsp:Transcript_34223/g.34777  ORF Transcript_34223/g.34777 Transcript_34223/m.34777 type:complete len:104 (+) Transcript_34223:990-1301(+)
MVGVYSLSSLWSKNLLIGSLPQIRNKKQEKESDEHRNTEWSRRNMFDITSWMNESIMMYRNVKTVIQQQEQKQKSQASTRIFEKKQQTRRRKELHSLLNTVLY